MQKLIFFVIFGSYFSLFAENGKIPEGLWSLGKEGYYNPYAIVVDKKERRLSVWKSSENSIVEKVAEYRSDQGENNGDKKNMGDKKTPEGVYFFQEMLQGKSLPFEKYGVRAFTMDYPNLYDRREGKTGYGIWLHAIPDSESLKRGSRGCVVVRNSAIMEISDYIKLGTTPILVMNEVNYIHSETHKQEKAKIVNMLRSWQQSWVNKDIDSYMNFYSDHFRSRKMNKEQWRTYKSALNEKYETIFVEFSDPVIYEANSQFFVRMLQHYRSDTLEDFGEKTLYFERTPNGIKIIAEDWVDTQQDAVLAEINRSKNLRASTEKLSASNSN